MSGVTLAFESKAPHTTPWLSVEYPEGEVPYDLLAALAQIGWVEDPLPRAPALDGVMETILEPPDGTDLFGLWTKDEAKRFMPEVRRLLRKQGFDRVPWNRLTLAEML